MSFAMLEDINSTASRSMTCSHYYEFCMLIEELGEYGVIQNVYDL